VRGPVDVVLGVAHDAEHAANDAQRQHGLKPVKPRHRWEPEKGGGGGVEISDQRLGEFSRSGA
jgi:hypothetical protein